MYRPSSILSSAQMDLVEVGQACGLDDVDRVPIRPAPRWLRRLWRGPVWAMTLPWAIYVDPVRLQDPNLARLLVHELVHVRQWSDLGVLRFVWRYVADYLRGRFRGLDHHHAYLEIRCESEARTIAGV